MKTNVAEAWLDLVEGVRDITHEIAALGPQELFSREAENPEALKDLHRAMEALIAFENRLRLNQKHPLEVSVMAINWIRLEKKTKCKCQRGGEKCQATALWRSASGQLIACADCRKRIDENVALSDCLIDVGRLAVKSYRNQTGGDE